MRVNQDVLQVLDRGRAEGAVFFLPPGKLDRPVYEAVNKVLTAAGGKWDRKAGGHVFGAEAADALDPILLTGEVTNLKKEFQAFYTPEDLAERVVDEAVIRPGMTVLEPSAGEGALARPARDAGGEVICVELNRTLLDHLQFLTGRAYCADFLDLDLEDLGGAAFDRVVMNPPFTRQADARHVLHAAKFLKPDGHLVAIMSSSVLFRDTALYREVRDLVDRRRGVIDDLPADSFKSSGTSVNTVLVQFGGRDR